MTEGRGRQKGHGAGSGQGAREGLWGALRAQAVAGPERGGPGGGEAPEALRQDIPSIVWSMA